MIPNEYNIYIKKFNLYGMSNKPLWVYNGNSISSEELNNFLKCATKWSKFLIIY